MELQKLSDWLTDITAKYTYLTGYQFPEGRFLEDYLGNYVAIVPVNTVGFGNMSVQETDSLYFLTGTYYVVWVLPHVTEQIAVATFLETSQLGKVKSMTDDTRELTKRLYGDPGYIPPAMDNFVAHLVEVTFPVSKKKDNCACLTSC